MINSNFSPISHRFGDMAAYSSKIANFTYSSSFNAPALVNPSKFRDETCTWKTRGMGLPYSENYFIILTSNNQTDRRADGRAIAYTRYSIYAVARNNV